MSELERKVLKLASKILRNQCSGCKIESYFHREHTCKLGKNINLALKEAIENIKKNTTEELKQLYYKLSTVELMDID